MNNFDPMTGQPINQNQPASPQAREDDLLRVSGGQKPPAGKKTINLIALIGGCVVLVALLALLVTSVFASPAKKLRNGVTRSASAISGSEVVKTMTNVTEGGAISLTADLSQMSALLGGMKLDAELGAMLFFKKDTGAALILDAQVDSKSLASGTLWATKNDLVLSSTALLGKTNYGINLKNVNKNLEKSVFNPDNDTDYALPQSTYDELTALLDMSKMEKIQKDSEKVGLKVANKLFDLLEQHGKITSKSEKISLGEKDYGTTAVTITLDGPAIRKVAEGMISFLEKDGDVKNLMKLISELGENTEEVSEEFYDALKEAEESLDDLEKELDDTEIAITGYLKGSYLVQLELDVDSDGQKNSIRFTIGPDPKNPEVIEYYSKDYRNGITTITYELDTETSKNEYKATITAKSGTKGSMSTLAKIDISWDKKEGNFSITESTSNTKLTATVKKSGSDTIIDLGKITTPNGDSISLKGIRITLSQKASFPSVPKYTDVLTLKEDEMDDLIEEIQDAFSDLGKSISNIIR